MSKTSTSVQKQKHASRNVAPRLPSPASRIVRIGKPRAIFNRRKIQAYLKPLAGQDDKARTEVLAIFKQALSAGRQEIRRRFEAGVRGSETVLALSFLLDQIISTLFEFMTVGLVADEAKAKPSGKAVPVWRRLCIVAVGGYGRCELAPYSDIDLLFLLAGEKDKAAEAAVERMLYVLWDLGLKVGHATRTVDGCLAEAKRDHTIETNLLESRYLVGERSLYDILNRRFQREVLAGSEAIFIEAKLAERDARHQKTGDTRYVLEPNIKEGKGGLRDLQTLFWITKCAYKAEDVPPLVARKVLSAEEAKIFKKAREFLLTLRCHIHYLAGRPEERLTFDLQGEIGRRMGYANRAGAQGVERFMKHYFLIAKDVGDLTRIFCAALEAEHKRPRRLDWRRLFPQKPLPKGFHMEGDRLAVRKGHFRRYPVDMLRLFRIAQKHGLDIHPATLQAVTRSLGLCSAALRENREGNSLFMEILCDGKAPDVILTRMNEAGILGRFIPDFGRVVAQMQHDMYHVYTVDEHTIRAIGILHRIETGELTEDHPLSSEVIHSVQMRRALYVAVLLHDIAKGRGGDHSEIGAEIALKLCPRLGLDEIETEMASWLVRHHLLMSHTAFRRDLNDPKTISDFVNKVQIPERLRLLLILTVVDIRAVGPTVWNGWKAALLRELYHSAADIMSGGVPSDRQADRVRAAREQLRQVLRKWSEEDFVAFADLGYPAYWLSLDTQTQARHADIVRAARQENRALSVDCRVRPEHAITEITIYTTDHPGLFAQIAGAIALAGGNIMDARAFTMSNGMALDMFSVQEVADWAKEKGGGAFAGTEKLRRLESILTDSLQGKLRLDSLLAKRKDALPSRTHVFTVAPQVIIDNQASATHTVIEINGRDRPGLLYDLARAITVSGLQISSAKISTYGERVVDVFYIRNVFGVKEESPRKLDQVKEGLLAALMSGKSPAPA